MNVRTWRRVGPVGRYLMLRKVGIWPWQAKRQHLVLPAYRALDAGAAEAVDILLEGYGIDSVVVSSPDVDDHFAVSVRSADYARAEALMAKVDPDGRPDRTAADDSP